MSLISAYLPEGSSSCPMAACDCVVFGRDAMMISTSHVSPIVYIELLHDEAMVRWTLRQERAAHR